LRIVHTALMSLLLGSAVPSVGFAQVLTPFESNPRPAYDERLTHLVPVATVSRVGDIVALDGARITIQIPIAPNCEFKGRQTLGVVVTVGRRRPGPRETSSTPPPPGYKRLGGDTDLLVRVSERLRAEAPHQ
jgi:hypothetical protein